MTIRTGMGKVLAGLAIVFGAGLLDGAVASPPLPLAPLGFAPHSQLLHVAAKQDRCFTSCRGKIGRERQKCMCLCEEGKWHCTTRPTVRCQCTFF